MNISLILIDLIVCTCTLTSAFTVPHISSIRKVSMQQSKSQQNDADIETRLSSKQATVNLITFDLDDTIFPVGPVVNDANVALINHLTTMGCSSTQDDLLKTTKLIRTELNDTPIKYTDLRKRAIKVEMQKYLKENEINDDEVVEAYELWEDHRHMAAERHLYFDTIAMLEEIKANHPDVVIAAITNGKGNPMKMNSIRDYFDFCVSGEDDDVFPLRKPHHGIYQKALEQCQEHMNTSENGVGLWIHVGDDLANDVGASAKCGAYAIWVDLGDEYNQTASKRDPNTAQPAWSTATKEELEKRRIMNDAAQQFVSARVASLSELPNAIQMIASTAIQPR